MCGLAGFFGGMVGAHAERERIAGGMAATLVHRGPDDDGVWADPDAPYAVGFRRLSIIDLSADGHQPMCSPCGRWVLAYNGEVYNFRELRDELADQGIAWSSQSDSEVVLHACAVWGVEAAVARFVGMFAFALWDRRERRLHLVRDRLGIKPLYWGRAGGAVLFGSELKALRAYPGWAPEIDLSVLGGYLRHTYCPSPASIYKGIGKLPPGHMLTVDADGATRERAYWDLGDVVAENFGRRGGLSLDAAVDLLEDTLQEAVECRRLADVPVGALLSGGLDSSSVVAMMSKSGGPTPRTFSIGFEEQGFDEAVRAREIAALLGTDHTELYVSPDDARSVIEKLPAMYDEPFADSSQIPTFLISELARRDITVALSGDGGDELFGGYGRFFAAMDAVGRNAGMPRPVRRTAAGAIELLSEDAWSQLLKLVPARYRPKSGGRAVHYLAGLLRANPEDTYRTLVSIWTDPNEALPDAAEFVSPPWGRPLKPLSGDFFRRMQYLDTVTYLPDDILTKVDRASMACSLEVRVPMLDHRLVALAWSFGTGLLTDGKSGKIVLREMLRRHLPDRLVDGPKMGFGIPIGAWLRGPLKSWAEDLLSDARREGLFDPQALDNTWRSHLAGAPGIEARLWAILMFQSWRQAWRM